MRGFTLLYFIFHVLVMFFEFWFDVRIFILDYLYSYIYKVRIDALVIPKVFISIYDTWLVSSSVLLLTRGPSDMFCTSSSFLVSYCFGEQISLILDTHTLPLLSDDSD